MCVTTNFVLLLLDGFPPTYLRYTRFLKELASEGKQGIIRPLFAFRGIEATIFTGLSPLRHGVWTEYRLKKEVLERRCREPLVSKLLRPLDLLDILPSDKVLRFLRRAFASSILGRKARTDLIPFRFLWAFEPSVRCPLYVPGCLKTPTLFDILPKLGVPTRVIKSDWGLPNVLRGLKDAPPGFWYLKIVSTDTMGHKLGPRSSAMASFLRQIDKLVKRTVEVLRYLKEDLKLLIMSDHGMSPVSRYVRLLKMIRGMTVKPCRDFLFFTDSTMVRFWPLTDYAERKIETLISKIREGYLLSERKLRRLEVPPDKRYGFMVFVLEEGAVFKPCFFHRHERVKGMHGYAHVQSEEGYPMFIAVGLDSQLGNELRFTDIFGLIFKELGVRCPSDYNNLR